MFLARRSGYRNFASGALTAVGTDGDYWSSSPTAAGNANAGNLGFNSGIVNPLNSNNRAFGFTVRCVQHLRGCFFQRIIYICSGKAASARNIGSYVFSVVRLQIQQSPA